MLKLLSDNSGFCTIYEAKDQQNKGKILKVLNQDNPKAIEIFKEKAKVLASFNHSGIPSIDGYFTHSLKAQQVLHCLVMEKVEGLNLQQWLEQKNKNKPISEELAQDWLRQIAEILKIVHDKNWLHRDIKPTNIMLRYPLPSSSPFQKRRLKGNLVLIDFGTAREMTGTYLAKIAGDISMTSINSIGFTPKEQIDGKAIPQSDFYGLGRTLVYLLTATVPTDFEVDPNTLRLL
ncbi:MAG: protein kinase [Moorea sp. SIO2B7]|nr:protein kinase [Moorena sp. SIO2B7]